MPNAIDEIALFQTDRGLDKQEYFAINEHCNIVEELLESIGLDVPKEQRPNQKKHWKVFKNELVKEGIAKRVYEHDDLPEHEQVDAYSDSIVFPIGALMKLGYDANKVLLETAKEINSRRGMMVDGKFEKDLSDEAKSLWYKADYTNCKKES